MGLSAVRVLISKPALLALNKCGLLNPLPSSGQGVPDV
ncbi:Uncharacterised protein [Vibrio cholerae]|nr:Uncharacterised protein [Vibrio cholerae]